MAVKNSPYILVDCSYLIYFVSFITWTWYKKEFMVMKADPNFDPMSDPEFKTHYIELFERMLMNPIKKNAKIFDKNKIIFCMDCPGQDIWRKNIYPNYKANRKKNRDSVKEFTYSGIFEFIYNEYLPQNYNKNCIIKHPSSEGDDVIAVLSKYINDKSTIIITADFDLKQLSDVATVMDIKGNILEPDGYSVDDFIMLKILIGDKGDEVTSCWDRLGKRTAEKLISNKQELKRILKEDKVIAQKFKLNNTLMNLKCIPEKIQTEIIEGWEKYHGTNLSQV